MSDREQRNGTVFSGADRKEISDGIQKMSAAEKVKAEFGLEIPTELVPLPSLGKCYSEGHPLHNCDSVEISPMTAREEDILMNRSYMKKGTTITELLRSCLVNKAINPDTLLSGDRNALMVSIRITGYGPEYESNLQCPSCEAKYDETFDLSQLQIRTLDLDPARPNSNYFEFMLPYTKKLVGFRFLTGQDEVETQQTANQQKKLNLTSDSPLLTNLIKQIVSIDGIEDRTKIALFVRNMPARDSLALRQYIRDNEPQIVFKQVSQCKQCEYEEEVNIPMGVTFLWPDARK